MALSSTPGPEMSPRCPRVMMPGWWGTSRWSSWTGTGPATTPAHERCQSAGPGAPRLVQPRYRADLGEEPAGPAVRPGAEQWLPSHCWAVPGTLLAALSLVAWVPCGVPQGERDNKRKQALSRRRQPLDHAQVTAAVSCCDQEPARQPGEDHGRRRAAVDTEDPRLRRCAPGDEYGPDRCRDDAAHREGEVARCRARGGSGVAAMPSVERPVRISSMRAGRRTAVRPAPVAIWQLPTSSRAAVITHRSVPE